MREFLGLLAAGLATACFAPACAHDVTTVFPPGLEPLEADPTPPPAAAGNDPFPEALALVQGKDTESPFVHATGYVKAPIADVWAAFKDPQVVADRRSISSFTVTPNTETGYDVSFVTHYTIHDVETVLFDLSWREGAVAGTTDQPQAVSVVYQKTFGSSFVTFMKGSIELSSPSSDVTELQFAQRLDAMSTSSANIASWTRDMFASVVARVHGKPLPTY